jgi:hypothetical protein
MFAVKGRYPNQLDEGNTYNEFLIIFNFKHKRRLVIIKPVVSSLDKVYKLSTKLSFLTFKLYYFGQEIFLILYAFNN